ncbi:MAG: helix-turn-helix domain-containing protein [Proteobacteria bacterium]|nr:helix-turn-helix domain-containing protein [Pseudomonadota bacterium]
MKIRKVFQFKLKPSIPQTQVLRNYVGCACFAYNKALALQKEIYEKEQRKLSYSELAHCLVVWKKEAETSFLKEPPAQIL